MFQKKKKLDVIDISKETNIIVDIIKQHHKSKGFTYGMEKTVTLIKNNNNNDIFKFKTKTWIKELLEILITKNILVRIAKGNYFVICVGKKDIESLIPITARIGRGVISVHKPKQRSTLEKVLFNIRTTLAERHGITPSVFINDKVMMNICNNNPKNVSQLWNIDGISDKFVMNYGSEFMNELKKYRKNKSTSKCDGVRDDTCKMAAQDNVLPHNTAYIAEGHTFTILPVRKLGGKMEGKWQVRIKGHMVTHKSGVKTIYSEPSLPAAKSIAAKFVGCEVSDFVSADQNPSLHANE